MYTSPWYGDCTRNTITKARFAVVGSTLTERGQPRPRKWLHSRHVGDRSAEPRIDDLK